MPGIAGIITRKPPEEAKKEIAKMVASMRHEAFYVTGTWTDERHGIYLGWAERDDPGRVIKPQLNETGDRILVFCGEEFPEPGAVRRLEENGHRAEHGAGGHLVHTAEEDAAFPAGLNGQFHGVLVDRARGSALLFIDRFALRRVYFHEAADGFYFAAEAKAILAVRPELRQVDARGLGEFVSCGCVLENRTLFKGIGILPWAAAWSFCNGTLASKGSYFSPTNWEQQGALGPEKLYSELREVFGRNLPRYFSNEKHVALSLSGGLDTRLMLAWHQPEPQSLPCYTFGGPYRDSRDVRIARRVAQVCRQSHHVIPVGQEFLSRFPRYAERTVYLTDGTTGAEHTADLFVNEIARQIAPVRLTGNYGDEVLGRTVVLRPAMPGNGVFASEFMQHVADAGDTCAQAFSGGSLTQACCQQISWFFQGLAALEASQVQVRSPFIDNELIRLLYRAPRRHFPGGDVRVKLVRDGFPALGMIRTDLGFAGRGGPIAAAASRFWNRATMRAEYACEHGDPRWFTAFDRVLLGKTLEKAFVGIHKFTHFSLWYRNELAGYVREMLLDPRTLSRPYLQSRAVEAMVDRHQRGIANYTGAIHKIITLEHIHRLFVDAP